MEIDANKLKLEMNQLLKVAGVEAGKGLVSDLQAGRLAGSFFFLNNETTGYAGCIGGLLAYHAGVLKLDEYDNVTEKVCGFLGKAFERPVPVFGGRGTYIEQLSHQFSNYLYHRDTTPIIEVIEEVIKELSEVREEESEGSNVQPEPA